jgi:hypothetical protein
MVNWSAPENKKVHFLESGYLPTCEVPIPVSLAVGRSQYLVIAPRDFRTSCTRLCMEGIRESADGYRCATRRTLLLKSANVSAFFSSLLSVRSTQLHTFSCGLRSGEYFGQPGIASIPNSANASVASLVWSRGSLSRRMRMRALSGKLAWKKGPTRLLTSFENAVAFQGLGHHKARTTRARW